MTDFADKNEITMFAAAWIARLDSGELSADQLIGLRDWAMANPAHMRELERLADVWENLDALASLRNVVARPRPRISTGMRNFAIAAGVAALVAGAWLVNGALVDEPVIVAGNYATDVGEQRFVEPGEGSKINLNTDSELAVDFSESLRVVKLTQGEAFFDVAPEDKRPFIVETSHGDVVVTGTSFLVRVEADGLEVVVEEGHVEVHERGVAAAGNPTPALIELAAGEIATVDSTGGRVEPLQFEKLTRKLDWRDGMLTFDGESLEEVVREVGRYTPVRIVIEDPSLREKRIGGYFRIGEVDDLLGTLQSDFDIQINWVHDSEVRLTAHAQ